MISLPAALGGKGLVAWRLDQHRHASTWNSGEGAFLYGGRWNSRGARAVYCSFDAATAILEVAVHKGFSSLDTVKHVLTAIEIADPANILVVRPEDLPNPHWLIPGTPGAGQQMFGDDLLNRHSFVAIPSAVSRRSWNLVFIHARADGAYRMLSQEAFALDTRLNPPAPPSP